MTEHSFYTEGNVDGLECSNDVAISKLGESLFQNFTLNNEHVDYTLLAFPCVTTVDISVFTERMDSVPMICTASATSSLPDFVFSA